MPEFSSRIRDLQADFQRIADRAPWVRAAFSLSSGRFGMFGFGYPEGNGRDAAVLRSLKGSLDLAFVSELHALTNQAGALLIEKSQIERCPIKVATSKSVRYHLREPWETWLVFLLHTRPICFACKSADSNGREDFVALQNDENDVVVWIDSFPQVCVSALAILNTNSPKSPARKPTAKRSTPPDLLLSQETVATSADQIFEAPIGEAEGTAQPPQPVNVSPVCPGSILRRGANWEVHYGTEQGLYPVKDYSAIAIIVKLVSRPHHGFPLVDLVDSDQRSMLERADSQGSVLDPAALEQLRSRLADLRRDKEKFADDPLVQAEIETDEKRILAELKNAKVPGGWTRRLGRTQADKAWDALKRRLSRLRSRLTGMPEFAAHLENTVRHQFPTVTYHPPENAPLWKTDGPERS